MKTLTEEQFKTQYGQAPLSQFDDSDAKRFGSSKTLPANRKTLGQYAQSFNKAIGLGGATDVFGRLIARSASGLIGQNEGQKQVSQLTGMSQEEINKVNIQPPSKGEIAGATLQTAVVPAGFALTGGLSTAGQVAVGTGLGYAYDVGQDLVDKKSAGQTLTPGVSTAIGMASPLAIAGSQAIRPAINKLGEAVSQKATQITQSLPENQTVQGVTQTASDLVDRVPRFFARQQENIAEQAARKQSIQQAATPAVANAIKVELPEKFINTIQMADKPTKQAYQKVVALAEEVPKTVGVKNNPTIVGGELAAKQYEVIENQRKNIGQAINEQVKKLGLDKAKVDMRVGLSQVDNVLSQQGITPGLDGKLVFSGKYTPAERARIQELYDLARESGDVLTPTQVRDMDVLFSKLQRETRMEGLGDIRVDVNGESMSMFRVFRDIYANQLENLSPELKKLNTQYRNVKTLLEDIEDSILKTPNFNITKNTDEAEFAKVNLRRIFGEAQSSPVYEAIADEMDTVSRQLGYNDAKPKDVAAFAEELRQLYPEITPRTGFQGGFRAGFADIAEKILGSGKADEIDQREALKKLLEE